MEIELTSQGGPVVQDRGLLPVRDRDGRRAGGRRCGPSHPSDQGPGYGVRKLDWTPADEAAEIGGFYFVGPGGGVRPPLRWMNGRIQLRLFIFLMGQILTPKQLV